MQTEQRTFKYRPRSPSSSVLWRAVRDNWQTFVADADANHRSIPPFVEEGRESDIVSL